jgi:hypothetical protein
MKRIKGKTKMKTETGHWAGLLTRGLLGLPGPWLDLARVSTSRAGSHAPVIENRGKHNARR